MSTNKYSRIKASLIVMSHISDAQAEYGFNNANHRLNFVKYIINKTNGDLNQLIDPDAMYEEFINL